jgi:hypothetical protein
MLDILGGANRPTKVIPPNPRPFSTGRLSPDPPPSAVEPWVLDLRAQLADAGYDPTRVDELIASSMARFQSSKFRDFVPLLVERSVQRALRGD